MEGTEFLSVSSSKYWSNSFQGAVAGENTQEASDRLLVLQDEISRLDQHEKMLDQHKTVCVDILAW